MLIGRVGPPEGVIDFTPECVHLFLKGVYGDFPHHNDRSHLDREVPDEAVWQRCWHRLASQLIRWYVTPSGAVGPRSTDILVCGVVRCS